MRTIGITVVASLVTGLGTVLAAAQPAAAIPTCDEPVPPPSCQEPARPPQLTVELVRQTTSRTGVRVKGWTRDADAPNSALTVTFTIDGVSAGSSPANQPRSDVGAHGFDATLSASAARHNVCVTAVSVGGDGNRTVCRQMDDVVEIEPNSITYDLDHVVLTEWALDQLDQVRVTNDTAVQQSTTINGSASTAETASWTHTSSVKVTVSTNFKVGWVIIGGGLQVTVEGQHTWSSSGSITRTQQFFWQQPVIVPARSIVEGTTAVTHATITVPFTLTGTLVYRSGARAAGSLPGSFNGGNSFGLATKLKQYNLDGTPATAPVAQPPATLLKTG